MSLFKYKLIDDEKYFEIEADYYAVEKSTTVNLRQEESIVLQYVFYKDGRSVLQMPTYFVERIRDIDGE